MNPPVAHWVSPVAQVHVPSTQFEPGSQAVPHAPQFAALVLVSTQVVPIIGIIPLPPAIKPVHAVSPPSPQPMVHTPFWQVVPAPQRLPQAPQFASSALVFVHVVPHCVSPDPQVHVPPTQLPPTGHCMLQALQLRLSLVRSTHELLQLVRVTPASVLVHVVTHAPLSQT
jgi:hypothetical protein